ncbi:bifunctional aminoglycoside phosphotransferase/ATP-binding protein [Ferrovibrio sp.]|uniref:bifunctional aminoglycoside phosphotransferase/ATP-binding protein n=1 Tax=Ferrovibrio sp. TaxID=1917215 RepID=UPI001B4D2B4C|nr:bifunctional aminoglycoside phosphotransferase/ATP-binding protein [Ferrovibrio sp.]MBP7064764.1 AAA family ATPase [Ferrovibrio sp.]
MTMRDPNPPDLDSLFVDPPCDAQVETHISRIYLAGAFAYKLKLAVTLPYLDFSSLAQRHAAALREVELNRRTAPELYLGLRAVLRAEDSRLYLASAEASAQPGSIAQAVEWLVQMRRFDADATLDRQLALGRLTPELIDAVAEAVAVFHAEAAPVARDAPRDALAGIKSVAAMNRQSFAALPAASDLSASSVAALLDETDAAIAAAAPLLAQRQAGGFVRRCHGDLHLRNICLLAGRPVLFDCLEFDDALAEIDTAYDIAFLLMDLLARDRIDLANRALNRYLECCQDYAALALLPLYLSLRAAIRCHVAALKPVEAAEARRYLALARRCLRPGSRRLLAIGGRSGTGKTTLARALAPLCDAPCGAVVLRSDVIRKQLCGVAPTERLPSESYTRAASARVYAEMLTRAQAVLAAGSPVLLDAVFGQTGERQAAAQLAQQQEAPFRGLWLEGETEMLAARVTARQGDASDATAAVVRRQDFAAPGEDWRHCNAALPQAALVADAAAWCGLN